MDHPNAKSPASNAMTSLVDYHDQQADECIARIEKYQQPGHAWLAKPHGKMTEEDKCHGEFPWNDFVITRNAESQHDPNPKPTQQGKDETMEEATALLEREADPHPTEPAETQQTEPSAQPITPGRHRSRRSLEEAEANAKKSAPFASYTTTMQLPDGRWTTWLNICTDTAALPRPQVCWKGSVSNRGFLAQITLFMNRAVRILRDFCSAEELGFQQSEKEDESLISSGAQLAGDI